MTDPIVSPVTMLVNFTRARYVKGDYVVRMSRYAHNPNKLCLFLGDGTRLTVNVEGYDPPADCVVLSNYSACEGVIADLVAAGLLEEVPVDRVRSGFVNLPVMRLTANAQKLYAAVLAPLDDDAATDILRGAERDADFVAGLGLGVDVVTVEL